MSCAEPAFYGTVLNSPETAPSFRLSDQFGSPVALSDFAGKVVLLTFLYTSCADVCPIVTETLRQTHELLGKDSSRVQILAITVDPGRDSTERVYGYSQAREMLDKWRFLVGTEAELRGIWKSYWLDPITSPGERAGEADAGHTGEEGAGARATSPSGGDPSPEGGYLVSHSAPVFLIDQQGYRRILFTDLSLEPQRLVHDVRLLLR